MHPVDRKSAIFIILLVAITFPIMIYSWLDSYLFVFVTIFLFGIHGGITKSYLHSAILTAFYTAYISLIFYALKNFLFTGYWDIYAFLVTFAAAILIPATSYKPVLHFFIRVIKAARNEKNMYFAINQFPNVVCKKHNVRTKLVSHLGYLEIRCRNGEKCTSKDQVVCTKNIVGTIGMNGSYENDDNDYRIPIWDEVKKTTINADYDIIEIHESKAVNYNAIIDKIVSFLYNEIDRYKPANEIIVRLVGEPAISESSKRLLKERFMKVEYINE